MKTNKRVKKRKLFTLTNKLIAYICQSLIYKGKKSPDNGSVGRIEVVTDKFSDAIPAAAVNDFLFYFC